MNTMEAFMMGAANRHNEQKVFDWDAAATYIVNNKIKHAEAGLEGDWEWTGGSILRDGAPVSEDNTYVYLASTWATPQLLVDDGDYIDCYVMASQTEWDEKTYWPDSALEILNGKA